MDTVKISRTSLSAVDETRARLPAAEASPCVSASAASSLFPTPGLTPRQRDCLKALVAYIHDRGVSPSVEQLKTAMGAHSRSNTNRLLDELEARRYIRRTPFKAHAIEVLRDGTDSGLKRIAKDMLWAFDHQERPTLALLNAWRRTLQAYS